MNGTMFWTVPSVTEVMVLHHGSVTVQMTHGAPISFLPILVYQSHFSESHFHKHINIAADISSCDTKEEQGLEDTMALKGKDIASDVQRLEVASETVVIFLLFKWCSLACLRQSKKL